ncbi:hypothetical protein F4677DRAFT_83437 [Hypoxylon crocopeplum]|nr:hypothetical protein F4677DRAFT_83437 [Hypoxylon crocopeplum]
MDFEAEKLKAEQLEAAQALSDILGTNGIEHAIIGGFALRLLGHNRNTDNVDVEIDFSAITRDQLTQLLTQDDGRFTVEHYKLFFTPTSSDNKIMIETLPMGELGLPRQLRVLKLENSTIPILHPAVLILAKAKRCAQLIDSTRPKSVVTFHSDLSDITFLLRWLEQRNEMIDFVGYQAASVDRLYKAAVDLVKYWRQTEQQDILDLMDSVLEPGDREKLMQD